MKLNVKDPSDLRTHEGAPARRITATQQLRRSVCACLLWERGFYEDGQSIASRIVGLVPQVDPAKVAGLAVEARERWKLRHVPLLLARELARAGTLKAETLSQIIQRPDELTEFMALYWQDGKSPISKQVKRGLAEAFTKFNAYQLAKYNQPSKVKLRDVLFLCHAKPLTQEQAETWKQLVDKTLDPPDTWEVALSGGKDKRETWERLLAEKKLGGLALLRNLRNMREAGVSEPMVKGSITAMRTDRILPFRFIAAARHAPQWEPELEGAMMRCVTGMEKLPGQTTLLVDVSGSMDAALSERSDLTRIDAACGLAILLRELCEDCRVLTFSNHLIECPPRRGFALRDAVTSSQPHGGTYLGAAVTKSGATSGRLIVLTDEQSHDAVPNPLHTGYMINVACNKNGVGYGPWNHIDGFSEAVVDWIKEYEATA